MTLSRLETLVDGLEAALDMASNEAQFLEQGRTLLQELIRQDDWLPQRYARPHPQRYQQYLLYCDPEKRFCIVSFVWGPGQTTPIHDHGVWALIGMLRGAEKEERFAAPEDGCPMACIESAMLEPGQVAMLTPRSGDIHRVSNAYADRVSISIHIYGGDIGTLRRHVFDSATGRRKEFVSAYANAAATKRVKVLVKGERSRESGRD